MSLNEALQNLSHGKSRLWALLSDRVILAALFIVNIWRRIAQQLCIIILLHFWTSNFSISCREKPKSFHAHDFDFPHFESLRQWYYIRFQLVMFRISSL